MPAKKAFAEEPTINKIMQLFAKQGYYHTSLDEIVTISGVKKQSLYNTFGDKRTLYLKSLQLNHRLMIQDRANLLKQLEQDGAAPLEVLAALFNRGLFDSPIENQLFNNAVAEFSTTDTDVRKEIERYFADYQNLFAGIILKGQADLTITISQSSSELAATLLEGRIGIQVKIRQGVPLEIVKQRTHTLLDLIRI